jgi:hypothetical protein
MTRRVAFHQAKSSDGELFQVVTIFEPGVNKETVKKENQFTKRHQVLVGDGLKFEYKQKRA